MGGLRPVVVKAARREVATAAKKALPRGTAEVA